MFYPRSMTTKRDKSYYQARLKAEHPVLFTEVLNGSKTLWDAIYQAGLKPRPTSIGALKQHWKKATGAEREDFLRWLASEYAITCVASSAVSGAPPAASSPATKIGAGATASSGSSIVDRSQRLLPDVKAAIENTLATRKIKPGVMMEEIGESPLNPSVGLARAQDHALRDDDLIRKLEQWLNDHGHTF